MSDPLLTSRIGNIPAIPLQLTHRNAKMRFSISNQLLKVTLEGGVTHQIKATSGRNACLNNPDLACQITGNEGPIPVGRYFIRPQDLSDPILPKDLGRNLIGDWGDFRVRIRPAENAVTHGRSGFFLHGGMSPGSRGCIDIGGGRTGTKKTNDIKRLIESSRTHIELVVEE